MLKLLLVAVITCLFQYLLHLKMFHLTRKLAIFEIDLFI